MPNKRSPPLERIPGDGTIGDNLGDDDFARAIASCAAGALVFPSPFDLTTSALLALVNPDGTIPLAQVLAARHATPLIQMHVAHDGGQTHVRLHQLSPIGTVPLAREIVDAIFSDADAAEEVVEEALSQLGVGDVKEIYGGQGTDHETSR